LKVNRIGTWRWCFIILNKWHLLLEILIILSMIVENLIAIFVHWSN
jgi:hypothetical protein